MIALIVLGVIVAILLCILFLPITVDLAFDGKMMLKIKYLGITLFDNKKSKTKPKQKKEKVKTASKDNAPQKKDNFIKRTYKQKGLLGTISYFSDILAIVFKRLWRVVKRFKFRRFKLDIIVATPDAANTAIQYGKICAAVYPVISLLHTITDMKSEEINIKTDFEKTRPEFKASILVKTQGLYWLVAAIGILKHYLKLQRKEREKYERKQH